MKKCFKKSGLILFFLLSFLLLLVDSKNSILLASNGLLIWFEKMIPTLFPFMVLSGCIVRSGYAVKLGNFFQPVFLCFHLSSSMRYAVIMGFLCGFPMGAKVTKDLLQTNQITKKQGEYLLAFTNNIGPLYLLSYVFPLFSVEKKFYYLCLFYSVPLLYGIILRCLTTDKDIRKTEEEKKLQINESPESFGISFYHSLWSAMEQITLLGSCMIIFNWLQIFPLHLKNMVTYLGINEEINSAFHAFLCSLIEIGGGLYHFTLLPDLFQGIKMMPFLFFLLTFGGVSCFFQTWFIIDKSGLSMKKYIFHKTIQALLIMLLSFMAV